MLLKWSHYEVLQHCVWLVLTMHCYLGLLHCRVRWVTPPPHVREHGENSDQLDQKPCTTMDGPSSSMDTQRPFKHHCKRRLHLLIKVIGPTLIKNKYWHLGGNDCTKITHWSLRSTWLGAHSVPSSNGTRRRLQELSSWGLVWQDRTRQTGWWKENQHKKHD